MEPHEHDRCHGRLGAHPNPNLWAGNCLTESGDGLHGWGEDHDVWGAQAFRHYIRGARGEQT